MSTDAFFITLEGDVHEERDMATADIVGAYLNADMDRFTTLKVEGGMVDLIFQVIPEIYFKCIHYENGKKVLYFRLLKALYECIISFLLWYNLFTSTLEGGGCFLNTCNMCVSNKEINGKQCTITWYIDGQKLWRASYVV